jgi:hypothetical protein
LIIANSAGICCVEKPDLTLTKKRQQILRLLVSADEFDFHRQCDTDP